MLVDRDGRLEEVDSSRGMRFVGARPELVAYARGCLEARCAMIRFVWIEARDWYEIRIEAGEGQASGLHALVTVEPIEPPFGLTVRELDVLTLLAVGLGNPDIATRLAASLRTITKHVENVFAKTGNWTRAGAAGMAVDLGLLRLPAPGGTELLPLQIGKVERVARGLADDHASRPLRSQPVSVRRPILLGAPLSLSGMAAADAQEMLKGAELAIREINGRGGIGGRELQLITQDCDVSDPQSVIAAHRSLIEAEVDAVAAGYSCAEIAVQDMLADYGCPYLHATTMESVVERVRRDPVRLGNIFQVCPSDIHYGPGMARYLIETEMRAPGRSRNRRVVVLQPNWPGMDVGVVAMERILGEAGWTVELVNDLPLKSIDWPAVVRRLHDRDPAVIMLAYYFPEESIAFQRAFLADPLRSFVYMLYAPSIPSFRRELGADAEGVVWATTTGLYGDGIGRSFVERYRANFGANPGRSHASIAYDRVNMLANSWARVGNSRAFGRVAADLRSIVHRGVNGAYYFGNSGQVGLAFPDNTQDPSISQAHLVFQIQGGRQRILAPLPYGDTPLADPPWFETAV